MNKIIEFPKKDENTIMCRECKIRPATRLCDYEDGLLFDALDQNGIKKAVQKSLCSKPLCDKCTHKLNKKDYCSDHWKLIKEEVKKDGN